MRHGVCAAAALALALAVACGPSGGGFPSPQLFVRPVTTTPKALLVRLGQRHREVRSLQALATMGYSDPRERVRIREALVVAQPDRLRIEIISAFGVALRITSNGKELRAWHGGDKTFYRGAASAENLARFTRLSLEVRQIVDILLGLPPLRKASGPPRVELESATRLWRMAQPLPGGGRQNFWFDLERPLAIRAEEVDRDGDRLYLVAYQDYRDVTGVSLPFEIALEIPGQEATISLAYEDVRLNEPVGDDLFSFDPPAGARTVDLDAEEGFEPPARLK